MFLFLVTFQKDIILKTEYCPEFLHMEQTVAHVANQNMYFSYICERKNICVIGCTSFLISIYRLAYRQCERIFKIYSHESK
jgi:hypothetical protein